MDKAEIILILVDVFLKPHFVRNCFSLMHVKSVDQVEMMEVNDLRAHVFENSLWLLFCF